MAGFIDLFSGNQSITGSNLFNVDKNPLNQLDAGSSDSIGKVANEIANSVLGVGANIMDQILGLPPSAALQTGTSSSSSSPAPANYTNNLSDLGQFFDNLLALFGTPNLNDSSFDPSQYANDNSLPILIQFENWIDSIYTGAGVTDLNGFINFLQGLSDDTSLLAQEVLDTLYNVLTGGESIDNGITDLETAWSTYVTNVEGIWDNIFGTPTPVSGDKILNTVIEDVFGTGSLGTDVQLFVDKIVDAFTNGGTVGNTLVELYDALFNIPATNISGLIKEPYPPGLFARGALTAVAHSKQFGEHASLSGHGALSMANGQIGVPYGFVGLNPPIAGRGVLTAAARASKFVVPAVLSGKGRYGPSSPTTMTQHNIPSLGSTWAGTVANELITDIFGTGSLGTDVQLFVDKIIEALTVSGSSGNSLTQLYDALLAIPFGNVTGTLGPSTIGESIQTAVDNLWNALTDPATYNTGNSFENLYSAAANLYNTLFNPGAVVETTTANAATITAQAVGNVPATAIDTSACAVFPISQISGTSPTTVSVNQTASAIGYILVPASGVKQTVIWLGEKIGTLTSFLINLYSVDTSTGALTYLFTSPNLQSSLSGSLAWNYWNLTSSVTIDAVGSGNDTHTSGTNAIGWSHSVGSSATMALVNFTFNSIAGTNFAAVSTKLSVTFGGKTMTLLAAKNCNNGTTSGFNAVYYLADPPTGTQSVVAGFASIPGYIAGNSITYSGVASLGVPVTNSGSSTSPTTGAITSASGNMVYAGFGSTVSHTFTSPSGTSRYDPASSANVQANLIEDAAGAASVTMSATLSASAPWSAIGVNLIASNAIMADQNAVYAVEMMLQGTGSYSLVGIPNHWLTVNPNVFPQSLGASQSSYASPVWDSNGAGAIAASGALTWSHTTVAPNTYVIAAVLNYTIGSTSSITAKINGVTMVNLGSAAQGSTLTLVLFGTTVAAAGANTIVITNSGGADAAGNSSAFTGVTGVGTFSGGGNNSSAPGIALTGAPGQLMFAALGSFGAAITLLNGSNTWSKIQSNADLYGAWATYNSSGVATFSGTMTGSTFWDGCGIPLIGAPVAATSISAPPYSNDVPWFGLGGSPGITAQVPVTQEFSAAGSFTYNIPGWVIAGDLIDIIALGGGGGGTSGTSDGGEGGNWATVTLTYGTQITAGTTSITGTIGHGGVGGTDGVFTLGADGASTTVTATGYGTVTATGGAGSGNFTFAGAGPGSQMWNSIVYQGGGDQNTPNYNSTVNIGWGNSPGGGGAAGGSTFGDTYCGGGTGAAGAVWFVARQH